VYKIYLVTCNRSLVGIMYLRLVVVLSLQALSGSRLISSLMSNSFATDSVKMRSGD
jgi:hypothetical protein